MNNMGMVPAAGMAPNSGEANVQTKNMMPQTSVLRPVLAPSLMATPHSGEMMMGGPLFSPETMVVKPHTKNRKRPRGMAPPADKG